MIVTRSALVVNSLLLFLYMTCGLINVAHAYLDLGTGSFLLQMVVAGILGALLYVKMAWHSVKAFFQRLFSRNPKEQVESGTSSDEEV